MIRALHPGDAAALLDLNNSHAIETSPADETRLAWMIEHAFFAAVYGEYEGFLIAFDQDASYDSENFHWFRARYERFVYIDRVIVAPEARGKSVARRLYECLFETALAAQHQYITCEVNIVPPNPASESFHATMGFADVGTAWVNEGQKQVRYMAHTL